LAEEAAGALDALVADCARVGADSVFLTVRRFDGEDDSVDLALEAAAGVGEAFAL